jgi:gliding motility-associated-like protein
MQTKITIKPLFFFTLLSLLSNISLFSQCGGGNITDSIFLQEDFQTIEVFTGERYIFEIEDYETVLFSFCQGGGISNIDTELSICSEDGSIVYDYNNNHCGYSSEISWSPDSVGTYSIAIHKFHCYNNGTNAGTLAYKQITRTSESDCIGAHHLCQETYSYTESVSGEGFINDLYFFNGITENNCPNCLISGEQNTRWYKFVVQSEGDLKFNITPNNETDDYDYGLWKLSDSVTCDDLINYTDHPPIRCNFCGYAGSTGLSETATNDCEGPDNCSRYSNSVPVTTGDTLTLVVSNWTSSTYGYTIDFSNSTANILDNSPPTIESLITIPECGTSNIVIELSEKVPCYEVQPEDFIISGPNNNYEITEAWSSSCLAAENSTYSDVYFDDIWILECNTTFSEAGNYTLTNIENSIGDFCGNLCIENSKNFTIDIVNMQIDTVFPTCSDNAPFSLTATQNGGIWSGAGIIDSLSGIFNPQIVDVGTNTVYYQINGSCGAIDSTTIYVIDATDASIESAGPFCTSNEPVLLSSIDSGGTWYGPGIDPISGLFNPQEAGSGEHTVYYFTNGQCGDIDSVNIFVFEDFNPTITSDEYVCDNQDAFDLSAIPAGGFWTGSGITDSISGNFDPSIAGLGTHTIFYGFESSCSSYDSIQIEVIHQANATIEAIENQCESGSEISLSAAESGGFWEGPGVNSSTGSFNPTLAGSGEHIITYSIEGFCNDSDSISISVSPHPTELLDTAISFCSDQGEQTLTSFLDGGIWTGPGITDSLQGTFNPEIAGSGIHEINYNITNICGSFSDQILITVYPAYNPEIIYAGPFCEGASPVNIQAADTGGIWSGFAIDSLTGIFDPTIAGIGQHIIHYTFEGECSRTDSIALYVVNSFNAEIIAEDTLCSNQPPIILEAESPGGIWSGPGITDSIAGLFNPGLVTPENHTIYYGFDSTTCGAIDSIEIMVYVGYEANFTLPYDSLCITDNPIELEGEDAGGFWFGTDIEIDGNVFDPSITGPGVHEVIHFFPGYCYDYDTAYITVLTDKNVSIDSVPPLCENNEPVTLTANFEGGNWYGSGITDNNAGVFNPQIAGSGIHQIIYVLNDLCNSSDTIQISVSQVTTPNIYQAGPFCETSDPIQMQADEAGGTWFGSGIDEETGIFSPQLTEPGFHVIYYALDEVCSHPDSIILFIEATPNTAINPQGPFCSNEVEVLLSAENSGGEWSGPGIIDTNEGLFSPQEAGIGTHVISYTIQNFCTNTDQISITVEAPANATINTIDTICENDDQVILSAADTGGIWTGNGIDPESGAFNPEIAGAGSHIITYTISGNCGDSDTSTIVVYPSADATILNSQNHCSNDTLLTLNAATAGGTWYLDNNPITDNVIYPNLLMTGDYLITYALDGVCADSDSLTITIHESADASISDSGPYAVSDPPQILSSADSGGIWAGNGVNPNTGEFTPSQAGVGTHNISYTIYDICGDSDTVSIIVNPLTPINQPITNVLSPNGDGYNDTWEIANITYYDQVEINVFNRYGNVIFSFEGSGLEYSDKTNQWDGKYNGNIAPMGNYVYVIKLDNSTYLKGTLTVVR